MEMYLLLDVETANDTVDALVYDIGWKIVDDCGNEYESASYVIRDIFVYERELVKSAYYAEKIPEYVRGIKEKNHVMIDFMRARDNILRVMKKYHCSTVAAYNAYFDKNALNKTLRYLTKSESRWFFPYSTKFVCIWNMACNTICKTGEYKTFAEMNRLVSNHGKNYRSNAEAVYSFIINDNEFKEEHKGLDDVEIEYRIMLECLKYEDKVMGIKRNCWQLVKRGALVPALLSLNVC